VLRREQLINKLHEMGFSFRRQADRVLFFGHGNGLRVAVHRRDLIPDVTAANILKRAGCSDAEIAEFLRSTKA